MKELNMRVDRINKSWTLEYVADFLGIAKQSVSNIEKGKSKPSYDVLCKMEELFKESHTYLLAESKRNTPINQENDITRSRSKQSQTSWKEKKNGKFKRFNYELWF